MTQETVRLQIPFQSLVEAIASLGFEEKRRLWQLLDREINQAEFSKKLENQIGAIWYFIHHYNNLLRI